jgi:Icc-related predicted phosphoesterase
MKITCISDTHNQHNNIPSKYLAGGDCIIHSGDMTGRGTHAEIEEFLAWYNELPYTHKILIAGNHDFFFERASESIIKATLDKYPNITYLNDSGVEIEGLKIWGSPVQPWFYDWAFNRRGTDICEHWDKIPLDTDILITHGPAKGYLDLTLRGDVTGCHYLLEKISELTNLKLFVHGHIHEAYGRVDFPDGGVFLNASVLNARYIMSNLPHEIEITK